MLLEVHKGTESKEQGLETTQTGDWLEWLGTNLVEEAAVLELPDGEVVEETAEVV